jgi:hypothetical protein
MLGSAWFKAGLFGQTMPWCGVVNPSFPAPKPSSAHGKKRNVASILKNSKSHAPLPRVFCFEKFFKVFKVELAKNFTHKNITSVVCKNFYFLKTFTNNGK